MLIVHFHVITRKHSGERKDVLEIDYAGCTFANQEIIPSVADIWLKGDIGAL